MQGNSRPSGKAEKRLERREEMTETAKNSWTGENEELGRRNGDEKLGRSQEEFEGKEEERDEEVNENIERSGRRRKELEGTSEDDLSRRNADKNGGKRRQNKPGTQYDYDD